jgi:WD40 repeat protein
MISQRITIINYLYDSLPTVIGKLISEYDYHIEGNSYTFADNCGAVYCSAELSGKRIVCGSSDGTLKIWNLQTGNYDIVLEDHTSKIHRVAVLNDKQFVSGSSDGTLKIWSSHLSDNIFEDKSSILSYTCDTTFTYNYHCCHRIAVFPDGKIVSGLGNTLKIWNSQIKNYKIKSKDERSKIISCNGDNHIIFKGHSNPVYCVAVLSDGRFVSGSCDSTLKIWNPCRPLQPPETNNCDITLNGHRGPIYCITILPGGPSDCSACQTERVERIVSGSADATLKIWNPKTGKCELSLEGHTDVIWCCAILPDGRIISGSSDRTLKIWNVQTGTCDATLRGHSASVISVTPLFDGLPEGPEVIISGSMDGTLIMWY